MEGEIEAGLAELVRAGDFAQAARRGLEAYGAEVYGFLIGTTGSESDAAEIYSQACEDFWKGLPAFQLRSSVRTWLYVLARHAAARFRRSPWSRRAARTGEAALDELIAETRSRTPAWQRSEVKDRFAQLRESLDPDDRALLALRVDRGLPWRDVARVMLEGDAPDEEELEREVVRLTKRYQLLKDDLRRRARAAGLIEEAS
jgi:RNA polymerase sigma-70 factor (ECF subfamily)